jgi:translation initiation factor IF-3
LRKGYAIAKSLRLNEQIRISPVRVIDHEQRQLGVIPIDEALRLAREAGLDLVEVSPTETPPVCRILDYGKFKYERKKRQKHAAGAHVIQLKEIRLRPKTDPHDRSIKLRHAKDFLAEGHKVQFTMLFRGRERAHREIANEIFNRMLAELGDGCRVERPPMMEGRRMIMIVVPGKPGAHASPAPASPAPKTGSAPGVALSPVPARPSVPTPATQPSVEA